MPVITALPAVQQLEGDSKKALSTALSAIMAGIDAAVDDVTGDIPPLSDDVRKAVEAVLPSLPLPPVVQSYVAMVTGLVDPALQTAETALDAQAHVALVAAKAFLDSAFAKYIVAPLAPSAPPAA
jgi:hypothetical protein